MAVTCYCAPSTQREETMDLDTKVSAALVAAVVALIGLAVTIFTTQLQIRSKIDELTQAQLKDVIAKRIEVYPALWFVAQTLLSDWEREGKPTTSAWATELLTRLMNWHALNGVFLSQRSYESFCELRSKALELVRKCNRGDEPTLADLRAMDQIYYLGYQTKEGWHKGLATWLKNDLGSYKYPLLTVEPDSNPSGA
jgi:hypothetical protein